MTTTSPPAGPAPGTETVIDLSVYRAPVCYTVRLRQHWDDTLEIFVEDVSDDERSRLAVADALERAAARLREPGVQTERV